MKSYEARDAAKRIAETITTPGWGDIVKILDTMASESQTKVLHMMSVDPEKLTGKVAIRYASRARALHDLKEAVYDASKILIPNPTGRDKAGG